MPTTIRIITWSCPEFLCTYRQDFDPNDSEKMKSELPYVPIGKCAACARGISKATRPKLQRLLKMKIHNDKPIILIRAMASIQSKMILETDTNKQIKVNIMTDEEIDNYPTEELQTFQSHQTLKKDWEDYLPKINNELKKDLKITSDKLKKDILETDAELKLSLQITSNKLKKGTLVQEVVDKIKINLQADNTTTKMSLQIKDDKVKKELKEICNDSKEMIESEILAETENIAIWNKKAKDKNAEINEPMKTQAAADRAKFSSPEWKA